MKLIKKYIQLYIILFAIFMGLKLVAYVFPAEPVRNNVIESLYLLKEEGIYAKIGSTSEDIRISQQIDGWTDSIYLNVAYEIGEVSLIEDVVADYCNGEGADPLEQLEYRVNNLGVNASSYGRQWFGAMVYIRPLLYFFNIAEIRYILQIVFWGLLVYIFSLFYKKNEMKIAIALVVSILSVAGYAIAFSFNVFNVFLAIFLMCIIIAKKYNKDSSPACYLFVTGAVTAYLDLFLTPFVSFGIITLIILLLEYDYGKISGFLKGIWLLIKCAINWVIGYIGLWISKWVIASTVMKQNMFADVIAEGKNVGGGKVDWGPETTGGYILSSLKLNISKLFPVNIISILKDGHPRFTIVLCGVIAVGLIAYCIRKQNYRGKLYICTLLLIIALTPYIYYVIMHFHTFVHYWVEYRYQAITVMALCAAYLTLLDRKPSNMSTTN
jgi:hypothetical protein